MGNFPKMAVGYGKIASGVVEELIFPVG